MDEHERNQAKFMRGLASELAARGATQAGIAWLLGALDPAHANLVSDCPSHDASAVARPQYVQEYTIDPPSDYSGSWDACILTYGGDNTHFVYSIGPQGTDFSNYGTSGFVANGLHGPIAVGLDDTELPLVVGTGDDPFKMQTPQLSRRVLMGRSTSRSLTIEYTGPTLEDAGTVVSAHFNCMGGDSPAPVLRRVDNGLLVGSVSPVISLREQDFPTVNTMFFAGAARDGIYLPQRVTTDPYRQVFIPNGATLPVKGAGMYYAPGGAISVRFLATDQACSSTGWGIPGVPPMLNFSPPSGDSFIDSTQVTVTIFRGLQPGASLLVKAVMSLAIVPMPVSNERPYVVPPVVEDPIAIEAYNRILSALPAAWPARYNFLGALGSILATIGRAVFPVLAPVARAAGVSMVTAAADEATRRIVKATEPSGQRAPGTAHALRTLPPPPKPKAPQRPKTAPAKGGKPARRAVQPKIAAKRRK